MKRLTLVFVIFALGACGPDDGSNSNTNHNTNHNTNTNTNNNSNDDTVYQLQDESRSDFIPASAEVTLEGVVVTAIDNYGDHGAGDVYVEEPEAGAFSGVKVYAPTLSNTTIDDLAVGDIVSVSGVKDEFALEGQDNTGRTMTEIKSANLEKVAQGQALSPDDVSGAQDVMADPGGEKWEGTLVAIHNVRATGTNSYGEATFSGGLIVGDDLMDVGSVVTSGTCYSSVVGVVNYFFKYMLLPRSAADFVVAANDSDCDSASSEICDDNLDNDGDGHTDCDDWDCKDDPSCAETDCTDGVDNDGDGYTDCQDRDCQNAGGCKENTVAECSDGKDNDGDGMTDCDDSSCSLQPAVLAAGTCSDEETGDSQCADGQDNDSDGYTDCADYSCLLNANVTVCATAVEDTTAECSDGVDNDGDGYTDCTDFSCQYAGVCPDVESTETACSDGVDNDSDGFTDCADFSCQGSMVVTSCEGSILTCSDGIDNDGNGHADCADFACRYCDSNDPSKNHVSPVCPRCP
ncbi:MAG: hypothetical protein J7M25_18005 [Deltaproteobacteria bacterium]|nr:hypothetical protein [Deltaproteobacteria bacterium]